MLSVDKALKQVYSSAAELDPERLPLDEVLGLVLAEDIVAPEDLPPVANSAMDGYAVISADTAGTSPDAPRTLTLLEDLPAGRWPEMALREGCASRIMTGAPLPSGADAVVRVEWTEPGGNGSVVIRRAVPAGQDVRPRGEDVRCGEMALRSRVLLRPAEIGMLAALGYSDALVFPRPRVAIVTTGNELVDPCVPVPPGCIRDSNRYSLAAQVNWSGACAGPLLRVRDEEVAVKEALRKCAQADLILTSGGVSVGDFDLVKDCLAQSGRIHFSKVAMRPGKPLVFGEIAGKPVFGLPGNPVSSMVAFEIFVRPALDQMRGLPPRPRVYGELAEPVRHKPDRRTYLRAQIVSSEACPRVRPVAVQGAGQISSLTQADVLAIIPEGRECLETGARVEIIPLWRRWEEQAGPWTA